VGIFDPEGLLAYAAYFRDALVGGGRIESRNAGSSTIDDYGAVDFVLQYKIGTHILEGRLQVHGAESVHLHGPLISLLSTVMCS
jgi:hypothetical protein